MEDSERVESSVLVDAADLFNYICAAVQDLAIPGLGLSDRWL